jgi:uncharacterized protein YhhL (DUF1145 family)
MQSIVSYTSSLLSQQGHVLSAYLAVLAIFLFRDRKNALQMARVARHAVWSAGLVITVHSFCEEVAGPIAQHALFVEVVHVLVTLLIGILLYQLGCLFETTETQAIPVESERHEWR